MQESSPKKVEAEIQEQNEKDKEKAVEEECCGVLKNKYVEKLQDDEKVLTVRLEELKKENLSLQFSIKAWQDTLEKKLEEYKQTEFKLNELHEKIWSAREEFCQKADNFCDEYGILSDWWNDQLAYVSDLENLGLKRVEEKKIREEIAGLEKEIDCLKKELQELKNRETVDVEVHSTFEGNTIGGGDDNSQEKIQPSRKKVSFEVEDEDLSQLSPKEVVPPANELFTLMNIDKLKKACRKMTRK